MDKILKDPIAPTERKNGMFPWSFAGLTKDQAQSGCLSAGNNYGVGFKTPLGKEKASSMESGPIPQKSRCFSLDEIFFGEDKKG